MRTLVVLLTLAPTLAALAAEEVGVHASADVAVTALVDALIEGGFAPRPSGDPTACQAARAGVHVCVSGAPQALRVVFVRTEAAGGTGVLRQTMAPAASVAGWALRQLGDSRAPRRLTAARPGTVSVDGGPAVPLPHEVPALSRPLDLMVDLVDCPPFKATLAPTDTGATLTCPAPRRVLELTARTEVTAIISVGDREIRRRLHPSETLSEALQPGERVARVRCEAPGALPWARSIALSGGANRRLQCAPLPLERVLLVRADVADARWYLDGELRAGLIPVPDAVTAMAPGLMVPPPATVPRPAAGVWHALVLPRDGQHRVCAQAHGFEEDCQVFVTEAGRARLVDLTLSPRPISRPQPEVQPAQPGPPIVIIDRRGGGGGWRPGPLRVGALGGFTYKHQRAFSAIGPSFVVDPDWDHCLRFEGALLFESGARPVFLDRWESETRVSRSHAALRCSLDGDGFDLHAALGAFMEVEVALGPWAAVGGTFDLDPLTFELTIGLPIYPEYRLGHVGLELLAAIRLALPGGDR